MLQATPIRSHRSGRKISNFVLDDNTSFDKRTLAKLADKCGIYYTEDYLAALYNKHTEKSSFSLDAAPSPPITNPSIGTPIQFLQAWAPGNVRVVTQIRTIDEIAGITTLGSWRDEQIVQGYIGNSGAALAYSDNADANLANRNINFVTRTIVRFELGFSITRLEEARAAAIRISEAEEKRFGVIRGLEITRNYVGFFGYNNGANQTYGLLNDPQLPAYLTLPNGSWNTASFAQIQQDIQFLMASLQVQSGAIINPGTTELTMVISVNSYQYLNTTTDFGMSVLEYIQKNYPKMRIVTAPEFNNAVGGSNIVYIFADKVPDSGTDNDYTFLQAVPVKFMTLGIQQNIKGYVEDFSNATAGILTKRPYAVVRATGT